MADEVFREHILVTVNGVERKAKSVRITREIATDLPAEVAGGGGMVAATGSIEWDDSTNGIADGRLEHVAPLSSVVVKDGIDGPDGALTQCFTGLVDSTGGKASDASSSSDLIDCSRSLARPVYVGVHMAREVSAFDEITRTGLTSLWMAHEVARQANWPAYHYNGRNVLWVSLAGSILPARTSVGSYTDFVGNQLNVDASITPTDGLGIKLAPGSRLAWPLPQPGSDGGKALEASIWCDPSASTIMTFELFSKDSGGAFSGFIVTIGGGFVRAYQRDTVTYLATVATSGWQCVAMHLAWSANGWAWKLRTDEGVEDMSFINDTGAIARTNNEDWELLLTTLTGGSGQTIAGLVVDKNPDIVARWDEHDFTPKFRTLSDTDGFQGWFASRLIYGEDALDVLRDMAKADLAGLWVDEDGVLTWMSRNYMRSQPLGAVVTSTQNLLDYDWAYTLDSARSSVSVKYLMPVYTVRKTYNLTVWRGAQQRFKPGEDDEVFIEPEAMTDWWQPDFSITWGTRAADPVTGSWWGGRIKVDTTDDVVRVATSSDATVDVDVLGTQTAKMVMTASGGFGSANYFDTEGWPIVRARGRAMYTEQTYTSTVDGPADAPAYTHETGWYVQTVGEATALANFLANATNGGMPTIDNVSILYDPTIRLGQRITVHDTHIKNWAFNGVVFRIDKSATPGVSSMTLGLRVTSFTPDWVVTLADLDRRWLGSTLAQFDAHWAGDTLTELDANPLG